MLPPEYLVPEHALLHDSNLCLLTGLPLTLLLARGRSPSRRITTPSKRQDELAKVQGSFTSDSSSNPSPPGSHDRARSGRSKYQHRSVAEAATAVLGYASHVLHSSHDLTAITATEAPDADTGDDTTIIEGISCDDERPERGVHDSFISTALAAEEHECNGTGGRPKAREPSPRGSRYIAGENQDGRSTQMSTASSQCRTPSLHRRRRRGTSSEEIESLDSISPLDSRNASPPLSRRIPPSPVGATSRLAGIIARNEDGVRDVRAGDVGRRQARVRTEGQGGDSAWDVHVERQEEAVLAAGRRAKVKSTRWSCVRQPIFGTLAVGFQVNTRTRS